MPNPRPAAGRLVVAAVLAAASLAAGAQDFPVKPLRIIVGSTPGGGTDIAARVIAQRMSEHLGQQVVVENRPGATTTIGVSAVVRSAPDGYTISIGTWGTHVLNSFVYSPPYDLQKDFEPVALLPNVPQWLIGRKDLPANNLQELIAWLKANPGKATSGAVGVGGSSTMCAYYFQQATGTKYRMVPYRGGAPALQDLVAGNIDMMCDPAANSWPQVKAGNVKAFAVASKKRWFAAPHIPTAEEAGVPGLDITFWHGAWAPKGTPGDVVIKLNAAIKAALADPDVRNRMTDQGLNLPLPEQQTPQAVTALQKAEIATWWPLIKAAKIKGE